MLPSNISKLQVEDGVLFFQMTRNSMLSLKKYNAIILNLPEDMMKEIFKFIAFFVSDLCQIGSTCREWHKLCSQDDYWKPVLYGRYTISSKYITKNMKHTYYEAIAFRAWKKGKPKVKHNEIKIMVV